MKDVIFEKVVWDGECYRDERGERVRFSKQLHVLIDGETFDTKLSFTTRDDAKAPCLRLDGQRIDLDDEVVEIASDCIHVEQEPEL